MLSGELTPLLKESIELWEADARLDVDDTHQNAVLFSVRDITFISLYFLSILYSRQLLLVYN